MPRQKKPLRRHNREGSYGQRPDGLHYWTCSHEDARAFNDGKIVWLYSPARMGFEGIRQKVSAWWREHEEVERKKHEPRKFRDFAAEWLKSLILPGKRTLASYEVIVRLHLNPTFGDCLLKEITAEMVQKFLAEQRRKCALNTLLGRRSVLSAIFKRAELWELIPHNPVKRAESIPNPKPQSKPIPYRDVKRFLEVIKGDRYEPIYRTALFAGMRIGEVLVLRFSDVDFDEGTIHVNSTLLVEDGKLLRSDKPKTDSSDRLCDLPRQHMDDLKRLKGMRMEECLQRKGRWSEDELLFPSLRNPDGLIRYQTVCGALYRVFRKHGIPKFTLHKLRHTFANQLMEDGVDLRTIMEAMGHSSPNVTASIYIASSKKRKRQAADKIGEAYIGQSLHESLHKSEIVPDFTPERDVS